MALSRLAGEKTTENFLVIFNIEGRYDPDQDIFCHYEVCPDYNVQSRDYVAVYLADQFESTRVDRYVTWQWADVHTKERQRTVTFPARHLPKTSLTYLLFAYISGTEGVIGVSEQFHILYFSGDPVSLSLISETSEKSSFDVLETTPGSASRSSNVSQYNSASHVDSNNILALSEGKNQRLGTSTCYPSQSEVLVASHDDGMSGEDPEKNVQIEIPHSVNNTENQESKAAPCLSNIMPSHVENKGDDEAQVHVCEDLPHVKVRDAKSLESSELKRAQLRSKLTREASENWKCAAEKYAKEIASLMRRIEQLEKLKLSSVDRTNPYASHKADNGQQFAAVVRENEILHQSVQSLEARLRESEITIAKLKEQLPQDKGRRRNLEQALIRERLGYENTLKKLRANDSNPQVNSKHEDQEEEEYHSATEENVEQKPADVMGSFVPVSKRSASALVRLGIENEPETRLVSKPVVKTSASSLRCPVCSTAAATFPDEATFSAHVNGHFPD